jgi:hypothetical protein
VLKESKHKNFINKFNILYSTSANLTNSDFNISFAINASDIVIYTKDEFRQNNSSSMYKINNYKSKKIR